MNNSSVDPRYNGGPLQRVRRAVRMLREWSRLKRTVGRESRHATVVHAMDRKLIVSLTSYPPRFAGLRHNLASLLNQSIAPDLIVLWIAHEDRDKLPRAVKSLEPRISIRFVDDIKSFKKLVYALEEYPDAYIVTADDDLHYHSTWLEDLTGIFDPADPMIACWRAHRLALSAQHRLSSYSDWKKDVQDAQSTYPSTDIMPTGSGGVLYYPGSLHPDVTNREMFLELAPTADDLWFFWMARRNGTRFRRVPKPFVQCFVPGTQFDCLSNANANDPQIQRLESIFGVPFQSEELGVAEFGSPQINGG